MIERKEMIIAFHLPQFHAIKENDEWWGKGFTEWVNVKKAKPLYKNHYQPRIPLNNNYYDLNDLNNMLSQMRLASKYGINGFCYYHYWFNGKLLLEKPLELIRDFEGEKLPYMLCWANEPWTRSWDGQSKSIIMPQKYGNEPEWEKHFQYILTFFRDPNYIFIDKKPVFVIYRCNNIPNCDDMINYWDKRCIEEGYKGIYIVEELNGFQDKPICKNSKAYVEFEPMYTVTYRRKTINKVVDRLRTYVYNLMSKGSFSRVYSFNTIWRSILNRKGNLFKNKERFVGGYVGWDNSPRRSRGASIHIGSTPKKFSKYLNYQRKKARYEKNRYIFINAWNEWGEGAYLEPDEKNRYEYLEAIKKTGEKNENLIHRS
ncbi:glycosyltransferase WbsX family protein [Ruminococcus flavefaciens]|uniref:glycosyltransferase WbsX family protein n=1 Tax=Ruminococcus flavefaciens TaxID=1265 RepID=UPI00048EEA7D|nr:glycoside hydrolase family 99-like domain-containing protein [Ruminococcus flavefaciens]